MDDDPVVAIHQEVVAPPVEVGSLVDAHAGSADEASQVALCQAQGDETSPSRVASPHSVAKASSWAASRPGMSSLASESLD